MKQVLIFRHAKSDWSDQNLPDFERGLNQRGQNDAPVMGKALRKIGLIPDLILASPAKRAKLTVKYFLEGLTSKEHQVLKHEIEWRDEFYENNADLIIAALNNIAYEDVETVMVVGHNPSMEDLVAALCSNGKLNIKMATAAIASLEADIEAWKELAPGSCQLKWLIVPKIVSPLIK